MPDKAVLAYVFNYDGKVESIKSAMAASKPLLEMFEGMSIHATIGDAADTIEFFVSNGELPVEKELSENSLVSHAKRELAMVETDQEFIESLVNAVKAFVKFGHSGGSASIGIPMLNDLLLHKNLSPLTTDPEEWIDQSVASGIPMWQNYRNPEAFSEDSGRTYYFVSDEKKEIHVSSKKNTD